MKKHTILAVVVFVALLVSVATAYGLTWAKIHTWSNLYVQPERVNCLTLPYYPGYAMHKVVLNPLNADIDLWVYGRLSHDHTWYFISASTQSGLLADRVTFTEAIRNQYSTIIACAESWGNSSSYNLSYYVGQ